MWLGSYLRDPLIHWSFSVGQPNPNITIFSPSFQFRHILYCTWSHTFYLTNHQRRHWCLSDAAIVGELVRQNFLALMLWEIWFCLHPHFLPGLVKSLDHTPRQWVSHWLCKSSVIFQLRIMLEGGDAGKKAFSNASRTMSGDTLNARQVCVPLRFPKTVKYFNQDCIQAENTQTSLWYWKDIMCITTSPASSNSSLHVLISSALLSPCRCSKHVLACFCQT